MKFEVSDREAYALLALVDNAAHGPQRTLYPVNSQYEIVGPLVARNEWGAAVVSFRKQMQEAGL